MADNFLNYGGLSRLWDRIKKYIDEKPTPIVDVTDSAKTVTLKPSQEGTSATIQLNIVENSENNTTELKVVSKAKDENKTKELLIPNKKYVESKISGLEDVSEKIGDLLTLKTVNTKNLVEAINEVYEKSEDPFRVKHWVEKDLNVTIPVCTTDIKNTQIDKITFSLSEEEGKDYQIVGMIAYEIFDSSNDGNRINCWPVCQFTGNGQKELNVRWTCMGTTNKVARRISAWVLLKHR